MRPVYGNAYSDVQLSPCCYVVKVNVEGDLRLDRSSIASDIKDNLAVLSQQHRLLKLSGRSLQQTLLPLI